MKPANPWPFPPRLLDYPSLPPLGKAPPPPPPQPPQDLPAAPF